MGIYIGGLSWSSKVVHQGVNFLYCMTCFSRRKSSVIKMRSYVIVLRINGFINTLIPLVRRIGGKQAEIFIFKFIIRWVHRRIVINTPCVARAGLNIVFFAEILEYLWCN